MELVRPVDSQGGCFQGAFGGPGLSSPHEFGLQPFSQRVSTRLIDTLRLCYLRCLLCSPGIEGTAERFVTEGNQGNEEERGIFSCPPQVSAAFCARRNGPDEVRYETFRLFQIQNGADLPAVDAPFYKTPA